VTSARAAKPKAATLPARLRAVYKQHVDYRRESALRVFVSFIVTFLLIRALTYGIRYQILPIRNVVTSSGLHIHHFVWGIFILLLVGFIALSVNQARWHPLLAIAYGIGAALVLDEFALWLNLQDVYWAKEGRSSLDVVIVFAALIGLYLAAYRFWHEAVREVRETFRELLAGLRRGTERS
jgi:hypothetical protein